jgi:two-component system OmpR family response regulator
MNQHLTSERTAEKPPCVLAVDDDPAISSLLAEYLEDFGMAVDVAASGAEMKAALGGRDFDLILLDLGLPDACGLALCSWTKAQFPQLPLIVLTAQDDTDSCVEGLGRGADDYVGKPFRPRELLARMRAVMRRRGDMEDHSRSCCVPGLLHDASLHRLTTDDGCVISLSPQENRLLAAFIARPGKLLSRDLLLDALYPPGVEVSDRAVDTLISNLRRKLGERGDIIRTVRGEGYMLT